LRWAAIALPHGGRKRKKRRYRQSSRFLAQGRKPSGLGADLDGFALLWGESGGADSPAARKCSAVGKLWARCCGAAFVTHGPGPVIVPQRLSQEERTCFAVAAHGASKGLLKPV